MSNSEWTFGTLKTHLESKIEAVEKNAALALSASEKAILKAENAADKRAEASNEIRGAMVDAQKTFADKAETERRLKVLEDMNLAKVNKNIGASQLYGVAAAVVVAVASIMAIVFNFK